jgi:hypothetical protein
MRISVMERFHGKARTGLLSTTSASIEWDDMPCIGRLSQNGEWMSCIGEPQVYVRSLADPSFIRQISTDGGYEPRWCGTCNLLFFRNGTRFLATAVSFEPELRWTPPNVAFQTDFVDTPGTSYDVSPDGQYLYVVKSASPDERRRVHLVTGWLEELRQLVPVNERP